MSPNPEAYSSVGLGTAFPNEPQAGCPGRGQESNDREQRQTQPPFHFLGDPHDDQSHICYKCIKSLGPGSVCAQVSSPGSVSSQGLMFVNTVDLLVVSFTSWSSSLQTPILPQDSIYFVPIVLTLDSSVSLHQEKSMLVSSLPA